MKPPVVQPDLILYDIGKLKEAFAVVAAEPRKGDIFSTAQNAQTVVDWLTGQQSSGAVQIRTEYAIADFEPALSNGNYSLFMQIRNKQACAYIPGGSM